MTLPKKYLEEIAEINRKLDRYKISNAMWWEQVTALREKYNLPKIE